MNREILKNKDSILFYEATRILAIVRQAAGRRIVVRHIIENVIMDEDPENTISEYLAGRPTKIPAGPVCAAGWDRLFYPYFPIYAEKGETLLNTARYNELLLAPLGSHLSFWDDGWGPGPDFKGLMPTLQGCRNWEREP